MTKNMVLNMHEGLDVYQPEHGAMRPIEHLLEIGILGKGTSLAHAVDLTPREANIIVETGTLLVHCPSASLRAGYGVSRKGHFPELLKRGVAVGLGSDAGNFSDYLDICRMMYLASTIFVE